MLALQCTLVVSHLAEPAVEMFGFEGFIDSMQEGLIWQDREESEGKSVGEVSKHGKSAGIRKGMRALRLVVHCSNAGSLFTLSCRGESSEQSKLSD